MHIKKHLDGGTLRHAMVEEIKRVLALFSGEDQSTEKAALELGITPRTLRAWKGPVEKGGWVELQGNGGMEKLMKTKHKKATKKTAKKAKKAVKAKKSSQSTEMRA